MAGLDWGVELWDMCMFGRGERTQRAIGGEPCMLVCYPQVPCAEPAQGPAVAPPWPGSGCSACPAGDRGGEDRSVDV